MANSIVVQISAPCELDGRGVLEKHSLKIIGPDLAAASQDGFTYFKCIHYLN